MKMKGIKRDISIISELPISFAECFSSKWQGNVLRDTFDLSECWATLFKGYHLSRCLAVTPRYVFAIIDF